MKGIFFFSGSTERRRKKERGSKKNWVRFDSAKLYIKLSISLEKVAS